MQLRSLETLARIAQVSSFSIAADLQAMTLSAVSMQMKTLEAELGVSLFDRACRPPRLTPIGRKIADQARLVIAEAQLLKNLTIPEDCLVGHFRLGFTQTAGVRILPKFIQRANSAASKASFQFMSGLSEHLAERVLTGQLDAAVLTQVDEGSTDLHFDVIASEDLVLVVPTAQAAVSTADLPNTLTFIHFMPSTGIGRLISKGLETLSRQPAKVLVLDSIEAAIECVKLGLGYTILPLPDVERYQNAQVFIHPPDTENLSRSLSLATRKDSQTDLWRSQLLNICLNGEAPG